MKLSVLYLLFFQQVFMEDQPSVSDTGLGAGNKMSNELDMVPVSWSDTLKKQYTQVII